MWPCFFHLGFRRTLIWVEKLTEKQITREKNTELEDLLHHPVDVIGIGAEGINEINEESEKQRERAAMDDGSERPNRHEHIVQPVSEFEQLAEPNRWNHIRRTCGIRRRTEDGGCGGR